MCFSNVFSLAPEINDFFRCLRLWNFSTGGKATEWSTFLKTGPPKRTLLYIIPSLDVYILLLGPLSVMVLTLTLTLAQLSAQLALSLAQTAQLSLSLAQIVPTAQIFLKL